MLICLIRLLVYRRSEFYNHTILSCTCASPSSFVIDFARSRVRIERERARERERGSGRGLHSSTTTRRERNYKIEDEACCISYTHIRYGECSNYRSCCGLPLCADGVGSDTEWHADHDRCRGAYVVFYRQTCPCCGNNDDGGVSRALRAVRNLQRGANATCVPFVRSCVCVCV